jgi:5,5'-dehydrodivanillate O-demethylase oxygenase subunit
MLSVEQNERLTRVGPGTPMGELMRRYWFPVATSQDLAENPVRGVRLLGENLTLFKDRRGRLGLVGQRCAHRSVDLKHGIPEQDGLRCPYHGWMYDSSGQCIDQPAEDPQHNFAGRVQIPAHHAEELGGLIWAYIGPEPAPLLPRWDLFAYDDVFRVVGTTMLPCNWLQAQENSVDTVHTEYMHGMFGVYSLEVLGIKDPEVVGRFQRFVDRHHLKIRFEPIKYGIQKYRLTVGQDETAGSWTVGHPMVFPNYVLIGQPGYKEFQIRVPVDDTTTYHLSYHVYFPGPGVEIPHQTTVASFEVPIRPYPDYVLGQDIVAWPSQGPIVDRSVEKLAETDRGLIMFRKQLEDNIRLVEEGQDPMNVFRDPEENKFIELEMEDYGPLVNYKSGFLQHNNAGPFNTAIDVLDDFLVKTAAANKSQRAAEPAHQNL